MSKKTVLILGVLLIGQLGTIYSAHSENKPIFSLSMRDDVTNEYPPGDPRVPDEGNPNIPDGTYFLLIPAIEYTVGAVGGHYGDDQESNWGGGVRGEMTLNSHITQLRLNVIAVGGQGGAFEFAEGGLKARIRPWKLFGFETGYGVDIEGGGSTTGVVDSYLRAQAVAMIGKLKSVKNGLCKFEVFGEVKAGVYDNVDQDNDHWRAPWPVTSGSTYNHWMKPGLGVDALVQCKSYRIQGSYQHVFSFGEVGGTGEYKLQFEKDWPITGSKTLGIFGNVKLVRESDYNGSGDRTSGQGFAGFQIKFGRTSKNKRKIPE